MYFALWKFGLPNSNNYRTFVANYVANYLDFGSKLLHRHYETHNHTGN